MRQFTGYIPIIDFFGAMMTRTLAVTFLLLLATTSSAHHGTAGQFDSSKIINVAGVVTKIRFVNPHSYVYFNVTEDDGSVSEWRCEMRAATLLKRSGWTAEMFAPGTRIKIEGNPARREPHGCYVETIALDDGTVIERYQQLDAADKGNVQRETRLPDGTPNLAGNWAAPQRLLTPEVVRARAAADPANPAAMGMGPGGPGGPGGPSRYQQSAAGKAASAGYEREDNPRFHCQATNIFMDWTFDQHINRIEQSKDTIVLTYGFMDIVRTIHLDMDAHPDNIKPSRAGHSIGKWDGDTLVVDTVGFSEGYLDTRQGVKHSDKLHVVEKFSLSEDGDSLIRTYTGEDPRYLTAKFEGRDEIHVSEAAYDPYNCQDLTEEVVEGF
jgi:hypothetical protein